MKPDITVLTSVFNEDKQFLKESVQSVLCQTYENFEYIIIDDGSSDMECHSMLEHLSRQDTRIRLLRNTKNIGLTRSLNRGLQEARGHYLARIDSDDLSAPNRLERQLTFMEQHPDHALIGSWAYIINQDDEIIEEKKFFVSSEDIQKHILSFNFFTHSSLFFRTDIVQRAGGYTPAIEHAQDYDLILKFASNHKLANIDEFLCFYRITPKSISESRYKKQEYFAVSARLRALFQYGFKKRYAYQAALPILSFCLLPSAIKKRLISLSKTLL